MKQLVTLFFLLAGLVGLRAQTTRLPIICGQEVFSHIVQEKYPERAEAIRATFEEAKRLGHNEVRQRSPLTIQVVVHVVWNETEENLSDDIIEDQIRVLNARLQPPEC